MTDPDNAERLARAVHDNPLEHLEASRAAKRAAREEAERQAVEGLNRRQRRDRGERSVYGAHLGNVTGRRLRGRR